MKTSQVVPREEIAFLTDCKLLNKELDDIKETAIEIIEDYDFDTSIGSGSAYLANKLFKPCKYFLNRKGRPREAEELAMAFDAFSEICIEANKYTVFAPTINTFCSFCNITTKTLKNMANENTDRGEIATMIIERLGDNIMQNILSGKVHPIGGIFIAKANFGMRDNDPPQTAIVNIQNTPQSVDEILKEIKEITKY